MSRLGRLRVALAMLAMCVAAVPASMASAGAPPTVEPGEVRGDIGDVAIIGVDGRALVSGDGSTKFYVRLPEGAACPGDSANDQWRINSFLLPVDDDPLDVQFGSTGPEPPWTADRWPIFADDTRLPIALAMLRRNDAAGDPGLVDATPLVSFGVLVDNDFPGGRYRLGMACSYFAQTTQYWDTEIVMGPGNGDPAALTWALPNPTPIATERADSSSFLRVALVAVGVIALGYVIRSRRSDRAAASSSRSSSQSSSQSPSKEPS